MLGEDFRNKVISLEMSGGFYLNRDLYSTDMSLSAQRNMVNQISFFSVLTD